MNRVSGSSAGVPQFPPITSIPSRQRYSQDFINLTIKALRAGAFSIEKIYDPVLLSALKDKISTDLARIRSVPKIFRIFLGVNKMELKTLQTAVETQASRRDAVTYIKELHLPPATEEQALRRLNQLDTQAEVKELCATCRMISSLASHLVLDFDLMNLSRETRFTLMHRLNWVVSDPNIEMSDKVTELIRMKTTVEAFKKTASLERKAGIHFSQRTPKIEEFIRNVYIADTKAMESYRLALHGKILESEFTVDFEPLRLIRAEWEPCQATHRTNQGIVIHKIKSLGLPEAITKQAIVEVKGVKIQNVPDLRAEFDNAASQLDTILKACQWIKATLQRSDDPILRDAKTTLLQKAGLLIAQSMKHSIPTAPPIHMPTKEQDTAAQYIRALNLPENLEKLALEEVTGNQLESICMRCHLASSILTMEKLNPQNRPQAATQFLESLKLDSLTPKELEDFDEYISYLKESITEEWEENDQHISDEGSAEFRYLESKATLFRPELELGRYLQSGGYGAIFSLEAKTQESYPASRIEKGAVAAKRNLLHPDTEKDLEALAAGGKANRFVPGDAEKEQDIMNRLAVKAAQRRLTPFEQRYLIPSYGGRKEKQVTAKGTPYYSQVVFMPEFEGDLLAAMSKPAHQKNMIAKNLFNCLKVLNRLGLLLCDIKLINMLFKGNFALLADYGGLHDFEETMRHPTVENVQRLIDQFSIWTEQDLPFSEWFKIRGQLFELLTLVQNHQPTKDLCSKIQTSVQAMVRFNLAAALYRFYTDQPAYPEIKLKNHPSFPDYLKQASDKHKNNLIARGEKATTLDTHAAVTSAHLQQQLQKAGCEPLVIELIVSCLNADPQADRGRKFFNHPSYFQTP